MLKIPILSPGAENGSPLQYSCLENPMDRGNWWLQFMGSQRVRHDWVPLTWPDGCATMWICLIHWTVHSKMVKMVNLMLCNWPWLKKKAGTTRKEKFWRVWWISEMDHLITELSAPHQKTSQSSLGVDGRLWVSVRPEGVRMVRSLHLWVWSLRPWGLGTGKWEWASPSETR